MRTYTLELNHAEIIALAEALNDAQGLAAHGSSSTYKDLLCILESKIPPEILRELEGPGIHKELL